MLRSGVRGGGVSWGGNGRARKDVYDVNGFDPATNTVDPSIAGAEVSFAANQRSYYLLGVTRANPDASRYQTPQWVYTNTIPYVMPGAAISLTAKLPNGRMLSAQTTVPSGRNLTSNYEFGFGLYPRIERQPGKPNWIISWENYNDIEVHLFFPSLTINYYKIVGGGEVAGTVTVPSQYVSSPSGPIPVYPSITTQKQCSFDFAAIDSAMAKISAGDPDKSRYGVHSATFLVLEYDLPLSKYYSSINGSLDQFSVRTDESVYSNINGGIGILGSCLTHWWEFTFEERYVRLYGYHPR